MICDSQFEPHIVAIGVELERGFSEFWCGFFLADFGLDFRSTEALGKPEQRPKLAKEIPCSKVTKGSASTKKLKKMVPAWPKGLQKNSLKQFLL